MAGRWIGSAVAVGVVTAVLGASACGGDKVALTTPEDETPSSTQTAQATEQFDAETCVAVARANLDLLTSDTTAEAQAVRTQFLRWNPPQDVVQALDHFVEVGGVHVSDGDFAPLTDRVGDWVTQVCP